jgi:hypothetical protein
MPVDFRWIGAVLITAVATLCLGAETTVPLPRAHAHNDYLHDRPLLDAVERGFCSVEADIFLVNGELLVAHSRDELDPARTLQRLYLEPLRQRARENGGRVHRDGPDFTLLIDIKSEGEPTYDALNELLSQYADVFSRHENGQWHPKAVAAIVSGNRPIERIIASSPRFAGIDGRLTDLHSEQPVHLLPLISDNWRSHFRWQGEGELPESDRLKLLQIVWEAHARKRRVRFWAIPDVPAAWRVMHQAGVDLINTDDLAGLSDFLARTDAQ